MKVIEVYDPRTDQFTDAVLLNRNGNLTLVEFVDGREEWIAPHEIVSERDEPTRRFPRVK